jgi:hypothetical protein
MNKFRALPWMWILLWVAVLPIGMGQDVLRMSRSLESSSLEVWQSIHSRYQQLGAGGRLSEDDLSLYFSLNAFAKSATLLRELAPASSLKDLRGGIQSMVRQAVEIENLFDRSGGFFRQFDSWRDVQTNLAAVSRAANVPYAPLGEISRPAQPGIAVGGRDRPLPTEPRGRFWWRGVVDGSDKIRLMGDQVFIEHIEAQPVRDDSYDLSSPLPRSGTPVTLRKIKGRGRVEIVEQPSSRNRFSVVVLLEDSKGGSDTYEFELVWDSSEPAAPRIPRP